MLVAGFGDAYLRYVQGAQPAKGLAQVQSIVELQAQILSCRFDWLLHQFTSTFLL